MIKKEVKTRTPKQKDHFNNLLHLIDARNDINKRITKTIGKNGDVKHKLLSMNQYAEVNGLSYLKPVFNEIVERHLRDDKDE